MANELIDEETLFTITGYRERASLRAWLENHHIAYLPGKRGMIVTTLDAVNNALGLSSVTQKLPPSQATVEIN